MTTKPTYVTTSRTIPRTYRIAQPMRATAREAQSAVAAKDEQRATAMKGGLFAHLAAYREARGRVGFDLSCLG